MKMFVSNVGVMVCRFMTRKALRTKRMRRGDDESGSPIRMTPIRHDTVANSWL